MKNSVEKSVRRICSRCCPPRCGTSPIILTNTCVLVSTKAAAVSSGTVVSRRQLTSATSKTSRWNRITGGAVRKTRRERQRKGRQGGVVVVVSPCQGFSPLPLLGDFKRCVSSARDSYHDNDNCGVAFPTVRRFFRRNDNTSQVCITDIVSNLQPPNKAQMTHL